MGWGARDGDVQRISHASGLCVSIFWPELETAFRRRHGIDQLWIVNRARRRRRRRAWWRRRGVDRPLRSAAEAAPALVNTSPAICVFMKPADERHAPRKELADRVVITWSLSEPVGGIQDFTWSRRQPLPGGVAQGWGDRFFRTTSITAKDAIVGIYPMVTAGKAKPLASLTDPDDASIPAHLDMKRMTVAAVDGVFCACRSKRADRYCLKAIRVRAVWCIRYVHHRRRTAQRPTGRKPVVWTIRGGRAGGRGGGTVRYTSSGAGVSPEVKISGNTITDAGHAASRFRGARSSHDRR